MLPQPTETEVLHPRKKWVYFFYGGPKEHPQKVAIGIWKEICIH
jgi:hypothetical protein